MEQTEVKANLLVTAHWAQRRKVVIVEVVMLLIGVASSAWHRLRRQIVVAGKRVGRRRQDLRIGTAATGSVGSVRTCGACVVDARHAESVGAREGGGKAVAVAELGWSSGLAVRGAVADLGREAMDFFFTTTRLEIDELHLGLEAASLFFEVFVFELLLLELSKCQRAMRVAEQIEVRVT
jgi:hypothetical protein